MAQSNYYEILGVSEDATAAEIRKAFQQKARTLHPDVNKAPDAEEKFKQVSEAYAVLSDEKKRARYTAQLHGNPFAGSAAGAGSYGSSAYGQGPYSSGDFYDLSDIFASMGGFGGFGGFSDFGGFGGFDTNDGYARSAHAAPSVCAYKPQDGKDIVIEVQLSDDMAKDGITQAFNYKRYVPCEHCHAHGIETPALDVDPTRDIASHVVECSVCDGTGTLTLDLRTLIGFGSYAMTCSHCAGAGKLVVDACTTCSGSGRVLTSASELVSISAHTHDMDEFRVAGKGHVGTYGARAGDLIIRCQVASERLSASERLGAQLICLVLPFCIARIITQTLMSDIVLIGILAVVGVMLLCKRGAVHPMRWWLHAAASGKVACIVSCIYAALILLRFFMM